MKSLKRRDNRVEGSGDRSGNFDGGWMFIILGQVFLAVLALTAEAGTSTAAKTQGAVLVISIVAILASLISMPWIGVAKVLHPEPVVSLMVGLASLFVVDFSRGLAIGGATAVAVVVALKTIVTAWRGRARG